MSDIIKCSGGEAFDFGTSSSCSSLGGERIIVVACEEDLSICKDAMESGVPVHSTELILGGVLRQELELHEYPNEYYYYCSLHSSEGVHCGDLLILFAHSPQLETVQYSNTTFCPLDVVLL